MGAFYLISGNEDFSIKERANDLVRELCGEIPEDEAGLEIIRGDTENEKFTVFFCHPQHNRLPDSNELCVW